MEMDPDEGALARQEGDGRCAAARQPD